MATFLMFGKYSSKSLKDASSPRTQEAIQTSIALTTLTRIGFTTSPAVTVDVFDKLLAEV